jgi:hypothetical protein
MGTDITTETETDTGTGTYTDTDTFANTLRGQL